MIRHESRPKPRTYLDCFKLRNCRSTRVHKGFEFTCGVIVNDEIASTVLYDGYAQGEAHLTHLKFHPETQP